MTLMRATVGIVTQPLTVIIRIAAQIATGSSAVTVDAVGANTMMNDLILNKNVWSESCPNNLPESFPFCLRCVVTNEVGRGMGLLPRAPVLFGQEKEKVYFLNESPSCSIQLPTATSREMG